MCLADHADDLREHRFAADALGAHDKGAGAIYRAAGDAASFRFLDGDWLAGHQRFIHRTRAFEHSSIDRYSFAGTYAKSVAWLQVLDGNVDLGAVGANQTREFWGQVQKCADSGRGAASCAEFEHLA